MATAAFSTLGSPAGALLAGSVFAAIGWLVTYTVENVVSVPTISYSTESKGTATKEFHAEIRNLSRDHRFSGLQFLMRLPADGSGKFVSARIVPNPPAYLTRDPINTQEFSVTFATVTMQPGTSMNLIGAYTGDSTPTFHIGAASSRARLLESGFLTWIIRNELCVLLALSGGWLIIVLLAVFTKFGEGNNGERQFKRHNLSIQGSVSIGSPVSEANEKAFFIQGNVSVSDIQPDASPGAAGGGGGGNPPDPGQGH